MSSGPRKYKTIKHFHEPGDVHELTFSCYRRMPLLASDEWRRMLSRSIDSAMRRWQFVLHAFVFMPEHVHLLVTPLQSPDVQCLLKAIKRPYSYRIKTELEQSHSGLLDTLTVMERPGKTAFRFWQEGPGYDRNLQTPKAVLSSLDYIHLNPVKRRLCSRPEEWKWSSAGFYLSDGQLIDPEIPIITPLPAELLSLGR